MSDNRNYIWSDQVSQRPEYATILEWIPEHARVIDLGCGNGSLLHLLKTRKQIVEFGIELAPSGVAACQQRGVDARVGRIDVPLDDVPDQSFDIAVCNVTLQMVMYPEVTLREMKRIAHQQIISFPNFAFVLNRLELLFAGRMPRWGLFGYAWYSTGHIHQFAIRDFRETARAVGLTIRASRYLSKFGALAKLAPNLLAQTALFRLEATQPD
ncbi:MAG: methyltransferase domain-containing protein [Chloroflexi bacterium]|nr:methyltransferase domain-containing protein [Chloroflexota bacterium]